MSVDRGEVGRKDSDLEAVELFACLKPMRFVVAMYLQLACVS